jgi:hypothetical protein
MHIHNIISLTDNGKKLAKHLWEENMHEPWSDYHGSDMFVVLDGGEIVGGFAVYLDDSDDIVGTFCSGWAKHHAHVPTDRIIKQIVSNVGPVYFKTDQRPAKILLEKIGKKVKITDRFVYYIVKGE